MVIGKGVVDGHIFEEPADVLVEKALDFLEIVFGVDKDGADVGFYYVGESLWRLFGISPIVTGANCFLLRFLDLGNVFSILIFDDGTIGSKMLVKVKLDR